MLPLVRSLVLRNEPDKANSIAKASSLYLHKQPKWRLRSNSTSRALQNYGYPYLVFVPTQEVMRDHLRVVTIARDVGMEFMGDLINNRLVFSWPAAGARESAFLPFPHLTDARLRQLYDFVHLSRGLFRVENLPADVPRKPVCGRRGSLQLRLSREPVVGMETFGRALAGAGWSVFRVKNSEEEAFVYRKVDMKLRLQWDGSNPRPAPGFRARELRLPRLNLGNAPMEILEYVLLMTDELFYLTPVSNFRRSFSGHK